MYLCHTAGQILVTQTNWHYETDFTSPSGPRIDRLPRRAFERMGAVVGWRGSASVLLTFALGVSPASAAFSSPATSARVGASADEQARGVARMVGGIISYSRWPGRGGDGITICTMGTTRFAARLSDADGAAGRPVTARAIAPGSSAAAQGCDLLYLGNTAPAQRQRALAAIHGEPVLSIAEDDPVCRDGAMFCVVLTGSNLTFRINVDAISRGTVRVDPRVLRLFDEAPERPAA